MMRRRSSFDKVLRKMPGNWSFVVVTDRDDLDKQIHGEFETCGVVTEGHVRAESSRHGGLPCLPSGFPRSRE